MEEESSPLIPTVCYDRVYASFLGILKRKLRNASTNNRRCDKIETRKPRKNHALTTRVKIDSNIKWLTMELFSGFGKIIFQLRGCETSRTIVKTHPGLHNMPKNKIRSSKTRTGSKRCWAIPSRGPPAQSERLGPKRLPPTLRVYGLQT